MAITAAANFYAEEAEAVYTGPIDFTVVAEPVEVLPDLPRVLRSVVAHIGTTAAALALAGGLAVSFHARASGLTWPAAVVEQATTRHGPSLLTMTADMRERADLAARLFVRTPHPGADDPEPDYGF